MYLLMLLMVALGSILFALYMTFFYKTGHNVSEAGLHDFLKYEWGEQDLIDKIEILKENDRISNFISIWKTTKEKDFCDPYSLYDYILFKEWFAIVYNNRKRLFKIMVAKNPKELKTEKRDIILYYGNSYQHEKTLTTLYFPENKFFKYDRSKEWPWQKVISAKLYEIEREYNKKIQEDEIKRQEQIMKREAAKLKEIKDMQNAWNSVETYELDKDMQEALDIWEQADKVKKENEKLINMTRSYNKKYWNKYKRMANAVKHHHEVINTINW